MGKKPKSIGRPETDYFGFFYKKAKEEMDAMWESGEMTQEKFDSFATLHERTPYNK